MENMNNNYSFITNFNMVNGLTNDLNPVQRNLSKMKGMYYDEKAYQEMLKNGDPLVYEFYNSEVPEKDSDLIYGTSIVYPGKVGNEFFMTKGHFHTILETAETYFCLNGHGYMMMESKDGKVEVQEMKKGAALYVPPGYAHRSINVSQNETLVTFFVFRADAGHEYGSIEEKGFRKLVIEENKQIKIIDNPNWK